MLNRHNLNIAKLAAKEPSRYAITGVRVEPERTVVTDGHCLVAVTTPKSYDPASYPVMDRVTPTREFEPFTLDRESALAIAKAIPRSRNLPVLEHAVIGAASNVNGHAQIAVTDLDRPQVFQPRKVEGEFPDYERVIPKAEPTLRIAFNPVLLGAVLQQAAAFQKGRSQPQVTFSFHDSNGEKAARLDCDNDEGQTFIGVVMPMRRD